MRQSGVIDTVFDHSLSHRFYSIDPSKSAEWLFRLSLNLPITSLIIFWRRSFSVTHILSESEWQDVASFAGKTMVISVTLSLVLQQL